MAKRRWGWLAAVVALVLGFGLIGCTTQPNDTNETASQSQTESTTDDTAATDATGEAAPADETAEPAEDGPTLVAYFSATGNTERIAQMIADATGGVLYRIEPAAPYTPEELDADGYYGDNRPYNESLDLTARPALAGDSVTATASYATVYLGYPIWYGHAPAIISTFLDMNDFGNATIYPFCTSGSSGIEQSETMLKSLFPSLHWMPGERFAADATAEQVDAWLQTRE